MRALLATASLLGTVAMHAHPEIEAALSRLNAAIAAAPDHAGLYLDRGELYARHQDWLSAEANYLRASELAPNLPRLNRARGALALSTGNIADARVQLDRALMLDPRDAEALILRVGVHAAGNDRAAALADLNAAIALLAHPRPELFLTRAILHATPAEAIRSLDEAIARIGPVHTLQLRALELEERSGQTDAALVRLAAIAERSERKESWLKRRGDLLRRAGRHDEARAAYQAALIAVQALPDWLRASPDMVRLTDELSPLVSPYSPTS